jgi:uncharacterized membrane protein YeaQ/YmgE (transglycosylase-associated protein family)
MSLVELAVLLGVAGLCGSIGAGLSGHQSLGCLGSIALGFIGALLGVWIARKLHLPEIFNLEIGRDRFPIVWSVIGAALFTGVLNFFTRPRAYF